MADFRTSSPDIYNTSVLSPSCPTLPPYSPTLELANVHFNAFKNSRQLQFVPSFSLLDSDTNAVLLSSGVAGGLQAPQSHFWAPWAVLILQKCIMYIVVKLLNKR